MNNQNPNSSATGEDLPEFNPGKSRAVLLSLGLIVAVLWPVQQNWRQKPRDNFPLSYYPMFSAKRDAIETFYYVVGQDTQGRRHYIPHKLIGSGGANQVRRQLRIIINERRATELAHAVAKRLARQVEGPLSQIIRVEVVKGKFAVDDFFHGRKEPHSEQIKGAAPVKRRIE